MTQVRVDVSDKLINEAARKEIKSLKGQVTKLINKNIKLESRIRDDKDLVDRALAIVSAVRDAGQFPLEDDEY